MLRDPSIARLLGIALLLATAFALAQDDTANRSAGHTPAIEIAIDGAIGPATSRYVSQALADATAANAPLVILRLDTPGGLSTAMRTIVQAILASRVPVAAYVGPSGARAASAGTYILYASHVAAMAPATNLGAATPVNIGGGSARPAKSHDEPSNAHDERNEPADSATAERRKQVNDAVAYIRSLAERRDRNADWAERAVREGVSLTARQALKKNVVEHVVANEQALLQAIDGTVVETAAGKRTLHTANLAIERSEPGWRTQLLSVITQPTVAYLLFMAGIYGLLLEGLNPGAAVPGVVGAISLLCALFAFQLLPINYAGLALIALGVGLIIAEGFAPSFGMLGLGGIVAFVFGSIMLMDTDVPGFEIPLGLIGGIAMAAALLLLLLVWVFLRSRRARVHTGREGLLGASCVAMEDFERQGRVLLHGETWFAESEMPVAHDQRLEVTHVEGLRVFVRAAPEKSISSSHSAGPPPARS